MKDPGKFKPPILTPDVLLFSRATLPDDVVKAVTSLKGVVATEQMSMASFFVEEQSVTYAAVNPDTFRRFTPAGTAAATDVWRRVAAGELAIRPGLAKELQTASGNLPLGNGKDAPQVHIGGLAELTPRIDAVVNEKWAPKLGMPEDNALVLSTGVTSPQSLMKELVRLAGDQASVQLLGPDIDPGAAQTAVLTGGSVAAAVGSFTYTVNRNGTVNPDPRWIKDYIRTEEVPILGKVTCNKAMLPQLRAALTDIVRAKLAASIHAGEYGGCFVPRYIGHDPRRGLSFHTWGTAVDLNVPGNQRGTVGLIDRRVVAIFARWGFNWGGNWHYTDPMHFELARLVKVK